MLPPLSSITTLQGAANADELFLLRSIEWTRLLETSHLNPYWFTACYKDTIGPQPSCCWGIYVIESEYTFTEFCYCTRKICKIHEKVLFCTHMHAPARTCMCAPREKTRCPFGKEKRKHPNIQSRPPRYPNCHLKGYTDPAFRNAVAVC